MEKVLSEQKAELTSRHQKIKSAARKLAHKKVKLIQINSSLKELASLPVRPARRSVFSISEIVENNQKPYPTSSSISKMTRTIRL